MFDCDIREGTYMKIYGKMMIDWSIILSSGIMRQSYAYFNIFNYKLKNDVDLGQWACGFLMWGTVLWTDMMHIWAIIFLLLIYPIWFNIWFSSIYSNMEMTRRSVN
jgi:hypothetical protein